MDGDVQFPESKARIGLPESVGADHPAGSARDGDPVGTATPPAAPVSLYSTPLPGPERRRTGWVIAAVAVVLIAAIGITVAVTTSSRSASPTIPSGSPTRVVLTAIDSTLGAKTADVHLTILITVPGSGQITATGDGVMDFTDNAARISVGYQGRSKLAGITMTELYVGGAGYLSMSGLSDIVSGKSWVELPTTGASIAPGSSNPADMFRILESQGDRVTPLGASQVDGTPVDGYHVVISDAAIQKRLGEANLPAGSTESTQGIFGPGGISMDVYVDSSNGMLRRVATDLTMTLAGQTVTGTVVEDTSNFGVPVTVTAPPADQVESFQEFTQAASSALGSSSGG
jgi:hypothetical protein